MRGFEVRGKRIDTSEWIYGESIVAFGDNNIYMPMLGEKFFSP